VRDDFLVWLGAGWPLAGLLGWCWVVDRGWSSVKIYIIVREREGTHDIHDWYVLASVTDTVYSIRFHFTFQGLADMIKFASSFNLSLPLKSVHSSYVVSQSCSVAVPAVPNLRVSNTLLAWPKQ
jgi:hypothetical protein